MTRDEVREELMSSGKKYCCYCGMEAIRFSCCGENHFETFADFDESRQEEWIDDEMYMLESNK